MKQRKIFLTGVFTVMLAMGGCMAGMAAQETETETEKEEWKAPEGFGLTDRGSLCEAAGLRRTQMAAG